MGENAIICPAIDARCGQVYNALFEVCGDTVTRLCDDRAVMIDDLVSELEAVTDKRIILCCDAAQSVANKVCGGKNVTLAPKPLILQNAIGVGLCAHKEIAEGNFVSGAELKPSYLKLPQAQRELKERNGEMNL